MIRRELLDRVEIANIDAFQGREKRHMIISTVRSNKRGNLGFLTDWRRLNVAITRPRDSLVIIGNPNTLQHSPLFRNLLRMIKK